MLQHLFCGVDVIMTPLNHKNKDNHTCFLNYKIRVLDQTISHTYV